MIANLKRAQEQSWEEQEQLSLKLQDERQANMSSEDRIREVMEDVRAVKLEQLQRLKRLQEKRNAVVRRQKGLKHSYAEERSGLEDAMDNYQKEEAREPPTPPEGGGADAAAAVREETLKALLKEVEVRRGRSMQQRRRLSQSRAELEQTEEQILQVKADLAAHAAVVGEDEALREAIQKDEREKLQAQMDAQLQSALDQRLKGELEAQKQRDKQEEAVKVSAQRKVLRTQLLTRMESYRRKADNRVASAEAQIHAQLEHERAAAAALRASEASLRQELARVKRVAKQQQQQMYNMMKELTGCFEDERSQLLGKIDEGQRLLSQAVSDLNFVQGRNVELELKLHEAHTWEPNYN